MSRPFYYLMVLCLLVAPLASCQHPTGGEWGTRIIADHLFIPWEITYGPDDHIWFTQKNGYICRLNPDNGIIDTLYHQPQTVIQGEGGMLGLALSTNLQQQPYVFVAYEYVENGQYKEKIVRLTYHQSTLDQDTTILSGIRGAQYHNGCRLLVVDDKLFISTGDATDTSLPQDISSLNGKVLRVNLDGSIPADNPIPGSPVWSWGHRNAQGLTYYNGILYSTEHGPSDNDEVNIIKKGRNYGWPQVHGFCDEPAEQQFCADSNVVEPLIAWTPTIAPCGVAYYHQNLYPGLKESLLMTTLKDEHLYQLQLNNNGEVVANTKILEGINIGRIRDICISPGGRIFLSTSNSPANGNQQTDKIVEVVNSGDNHIPGVKKQTGAVIYPNPTKGGVHITFPNANYGKIPYLLYDRAGRLLREGEMINQFISLGQQAKGIYFLKIPLSDQVYKIILK